MTIIRVTTKTRIINRTGVIAYRQIFPLLFGLGLYRIYIENTNE